MLFGGQNHPFGVLTFSLYCIHVTLKLIQILNAQPFITNDYRFLLVMLFDSNHKKMLKRRKDYFDQQMECKAFVHLLKYTKNKILVLGIFMK